MRRVKIETREKDESIVDELRRKYKSFKNRHPSDQARVPHEIKLLAQTIIDSQFRSVNDLSREIGLSSTAIRSWLKTLKHNGSGGKGSEKRIDSARDPSNALRVAEKVDDVRGQLEEEFVQLTQNIHRLDNSSQQRLFELTARLIELGVSVERISALGSVHPLTVRSWIKNSKATPARQEPMSETVTQVLQAHSTAASHQSQHEDEATESNERVSPPDSKAAFKASQDETSSSGNWVRIRVSGHMLEIDWRDLIQKLPVTDQSEARGEIEFTQPADGNMDFNLVLNQDHDFTKVMDLFEKLFIQAALKRHKSIAECATALKLPRSTLDAKRRKYQLI